MKINTRKKIILLVLGVTLVLLFWGSTALQEEYGQLVTFFENHVADRPVLSVLIFIVLTILSVMFFFFSSVFFVPVAVSVWGGLTTTILLLFGWLLGAVFSYLIGRFAGYPILQRFISNKKLDYFHHLFSKNSSLLSVFLLRFTLPSEIPGYVLGILRFNFTKYFWITLLAEIPYAFVTVYAFDAILRKDPLILGLIIGIWLIAVAILVKLIYREVQKSKNQ